MTRSSESMKSLSVWIALGAVLSVAGVIGFQRLYAVDFDSAAAVVSVALAASYGYIRFSWIVLRAVAKRTSETVESDPSLERALVPLAIASVILVVSVLFIGVAVTSAIVYSSLQLPWAVSLAVRVLTILGYCAGGCVLFFILYAPLLMMWRHRHRVIGEVRQFRNVIESELQSKFLQGGRKAA